MKAVLLFLTLAVAVLAAPQESRNLAKQSVPPGIKNPNQGLKQVGFAGVSATSVTNANKQAATYSVGKSITPPEEFQLKGVASVVATAPAPAVRVDAENTALVANSQGNQQEIKTQPLENGHQHVNPEFAEGPAFGEYEAPLSSPAESSSTSQQPATVVSTSVNEPSEYEQSRPANVASNTGYVSTLAHHFAPHDPNADSTSYNHGYVLSNGQHHEESATFEKRPAVPTAENGYQNFTWVKVVRGSHSHVGPDGKRYSTHYTADDTGFHPYGDHILPAGGHVV
ncbi:hypothetical protein QAD02_016851 [Eretmocerus hayati]|uniref:Uncharacterized protein n=1 Tax=Eretmocerus hayati TaxID=131215 RepID=A0ACC2PER4_9HYME|nr:hypothetical protein QAD02_016851 [Eretmocerus hayati]